MNISKTKLEDFSVNDLARPQPTPGYMRLVKDCVLHAWRDLNTGAKQRIAEVERQLKTIQRKLDRPRTAPSDREPTQPADVTCKNGLREPKSVYAPRDQL